MTDDTQKETERIHQGIVESLSFLDALAKRDEEIERLRGELADVTSKPFAYCTEPRSEILTRQQAEIERLRDLVYAYPPTANTTGQTWKEAAYANREEVARLDALLRSGVRCPHCDELRLELGEARAEIERLHAALQQIASLPGADNEAAYALRAIAHATLGGG